MGCRLAARRSAKAFLNMKGEEILNQLKQGEIHAGINKYVNPKKDAKFSPNLYRYLTWHNCKCFIKVFQDSETNYYYMGAMVDNDWFLGTKLMEIFCYGSKSKSFAYAPKHCKGFKDVTNWFWNKYFEIGKAIYDSPEWNKPNYIDAKD